MRARPRTVIDIGHDHAISFYVWAPDRDLNPQYAGIPDIDPCGVIVHHKRPDNGDECEGACAFDMPHAAEIFGPDRARWTLVSLDPLTMEPSILCKLCNDHGYIRDGQWVPA